MTENKLSPLDERHRALGAKMADFGGWDMPIEYPGGGVVREHTAVRERVGIFDVSHLGKATVKGAGALDFVNSCLTNDLRKIGPGQAQYTMCCDESGGVVDDLIVYVKAEDDLFLIPNAANTAEVVRRLSMAEPLVTFALIDEDDGRTLFRADAESGGGDGGTAMNARIARVMGRDFAENAIAIDAATDNAGVKAAVDQIQFEVESLTQEDIGLNSFSSPELQEYMKQIPSCSELAGS